MRLRRCPPNRPGRSLSYGRPSAPSRVHIAATISHARRRPRSTRMSATTTRLADRVDALPWADLTAQLDDRGFAVTEPLLTEAEAHELADLFDGGRFRSTIEMARHRFGDGRYRYFAHPLPHA